MARKNRKKQRDGNRVIVRGVPLIVALAAIGLVYLRLHNHCEDVGRQIKKLELERDELHKQVVNEERHWANARSNRNMERLLTHHGMVMSWPAERDIIRLKALEPDEPVQLAFQTAPAPARD